MDFKLLGSILLVVGTSIGAGMLALPIATAELGFFNSLLLLFACWGVMTIGALLILEVNLWLPQNSNLISMARSTIGPVGKVIALFSYVLLLYSLLSAYIAGGSDLFHNILIVENINAPASVSAFLFTLIFGFIVYLGIRAVDYVNRGLMFVKLGAFVILIALLSPHISASNLAVGSVGAMTQATAIMVTITSFGYATIIPSLRIYFAGDVAKLKKAIVIGSLIPLICYIFWDAVIMGVIPIDGEQGLLAILGSSTSTSDLVNTVSSVVNTESVKVFTKLFTSVCVLTSFLGVALCLTDFLADGLQYEKTGWANLWISLLTFVPPFVIVLFFPGAFIYALKYAGILCVILLLILPAWMAWSGRSRYKLADTYHVVGGRWTLALVLIFSFALIARSVI